METLRAIERRLLQAEKYILIAFLLVMVSLSFVQVVLRGLFSGGFLWADTFLRHLVLWVGFFGAAVAAGENKQFAMDAAARALQGRMKAACEIVAYLFTTIVCGFLTRASWAFLIEERATGGVLFSIGASLQVPSWYFEIILPVGFALLLVHYALKIIIAIPRLRKP
ncbi:MAG: TRAP transporter small permease subunit [Elusimicrobiota bacterium]